MDSKPMEILDVVDKNDNVIGAIPRPEIYAANLLHRIVHVLVFNERGDLALQKRAADVPYKPGHWSTTAGGHVKSGENYFEAATRELTEEVGITEPITHLTTTLYAPEVGIQKFLGLFTVTHSGPFIPDPSEIELVEFFSLDEIRARLTAGELFHPELLFILKKFYSL